MNYGGCGSCGGQSYGEIDIGPQPLGVYGEGYGSPGYGQLVYGAIPEKTDAIAKLMAFAKDQPAFAAGVLILGVVAAKTYL
jgi:hypothetical protein